MLGYIARKHTRKLREEFEKVKKMLMMRKPGENITNDQVYKALRVQLKVKQESTKNIKPDKQQEKERDLRKQFENLYNRHFQKQKTLKFVVPHHFTKQATMKFEPVLPSSAKITPIPGPDLLNTQTIGEAKHLKILQLFKPRFDQIIDTSERK